VKSFKEYLNEIDSYVPYVIPTEYNKGGQPLQNGVPLKDLGIRHRWWLEDPPLEWWENPAWSDIYSKLFANIYGYAPWYDMLSWFESLPFGEFDDMPEMPDCDRSTPDCQALWEQHWQDFIIWLQENLQGLWERYQELNPDGTWSDFWCYMQVCDFENQDWPAEPWEDWPSDWPWPPFQNPDDQDGDITPTSPTKIPPQWPLNRPYA